MTRAADRLIVCGYRGKLENDASWQAMVTRALSANSDRCQATTFSSGDEEWNGYRWRAPAGPEKSIPRLDALAQQSLLPPIPPDLSKPLPPSPPLPRPLSPSGAGAVIENEDSEAGFISPLFGEQAAGGRALQKGRLVHRLLQTLPSFEAQERAAAAERYLSRAAAYWPEGERRQLATAVLAVLARPDLDPAFGPDSQPEVSIMGTFRLASQERAVSGRIDRLAVTSDKRVLILDYKTNRFPPRSIDAVPFSHRAQLAVYREILKPLYPEHQIECILVYTQTAEVINLSVEVLEASLAELNTK
jgi:ATP-dependent helicase/nuclease subunit A